MSLDSPLVAGVDGCPAGWVAAIGPCEEGSPWIVVAETLESIVRHHPRVAQWAIDMPLGLAEDGQRECDRIARERLGKHRRAGVFSAPPRRLAEADRLDYRGACELAHQLSGRKVSRQTWNLLPKIREARRLLLRGTKRPRRFFENHPELAFARLSSEGPLACSKKSPEGRNQRIALLREQLVSGVVERALLQTSGTSGVAIDDTLDALACWTVAQRAAQGEVESLPEEVAADADGIPMAIRC